MPLKKLFIFSIIYASFFNNLNGEDQNIQSSVSDEGSLNSSENIKIENNTLNSSEQTDNNSNNEDRNQTSDNQNEDSIKPEQNNSNSQTDEAFKNETGQSQISATVVDNSQESSTDAKDSTVNQKSTDQNSNVLQQSQNVSENENSSNSKSNDNSLPQSTLNQGVSVEPTNKNEETLTAHSDNQQNLNSQNINQDSPPKIQNNSDVETPVFQVPNQNKDQEPNINIPIPSPSIESNKQDEVSTPKYFPDSNIEKSENSEEKTNSEDSEDSKLKKPSQVKEIENSVYEETSEFKSADAILNSKNIELKKIYAISENWMEYTADSDYDSSSEKFHLIVIKGSGTLYLKVKKKDKSHDKTISIELDTSYEMSYIPINTSVFLNKKGDSFSIKMSTGIFGIFDMPKLKVDLVDSITMEFNQNHRIISEFIHKVKYKIIRPDIHKNKDGKDDRLQFILQSSLDTQKLKGNEQISMFINRKKEYPTSSDYDFRATGNMGFGLIKSLHKGNSNYCIEMGCEYYISIYTKNVKELFFFPTVFANFSELNFHRYLYLLEEVEGTEHVSYQLNVPYQEGDWLFIIQPIEGYPGMYINPDFIPEKLDQYKYKSVGEKAEEVVITSKEAHQYKFSYKKFFVTFTGDDDEVSVSSFKFEVKKADSDRMKFLKMNYAESGVVGNDEIIDYTLNFDVDEPEYISFELILKSIVGRSLLILKECDDYDENCFISPKDVKTCKRMLKNEKNESTQDMTSRRVLQQVPYSQYQQQYPAYNNSSPQNYPNNSYFPSSNQQMQNQNNQMQRGSEEYYDPNARPDNQPSYQNIQTAPMQNAQLYEPRNEPTYIDQSNVSYLPENPTDNSLEIELPKPEPYNIPQNIQNNFNNPLDEERDYNDEMISDAEIKQAEFEDKRQNPLLNNDLMQLPNDESMNSNFYQRDSEMNPINPGQAILTNEDAQKLEEEIEDSGFTSQINKEEKDEEMNYIKDYENIKNMNNQDRNSLGFLNGDNRNEVPGSEIVDLDSFDVKPKPEGFEYDLEDKVDESQIRCVGGEGKNGKRGFNKLLMDFNCLGEQNSNRGTTFEQLKPEYPYSQKCLFAVGIYGNNKKGSKDGGSYFSVTGNGGLVHKKMMMKESKEIIIEEEDFSYLRYDLSKYNPTPNSKIELKIVAITGVCEVYVSKFNQYPSKEDNEQSVNFSNEHFMSVRTSEKKILTNFETFGPFASLFVSIHASEYCVLDFYVHKISPDEKESCCEKLKKGKMVKRRITKEDFIDVLSTSDKEVFGRGFHFEISSDSFHLNQNTRLVLNSNVIGLKLCLQKGKKKFIPEESCDVTSENGIVEIPDLITLLEPHSVWSVGVILEVFRLSFKRSRLPIEFSLVLHSGKESTETLHILDPGRSFESPIKKGEVILFKVNLLDIIEKSLFILTSEDKTIKGQISLNQYNFSKPRFTLDSENYALELNHTEEELICENEDFTNCVFFIKITSKSRDQVRFSLTYTIDEIPITLKEGQELFIPNKENMYFLYDPDPLFPAELNLESDHTEFLVYAKLVELEDVRTKSLSEIISEFDFDFKTDISKLEQLRIPQKNIAESGKEVVVAYLVAPKFGRLESDEPIIYYSSARSAKIHVKSKMSKLQPNVEGVATLVKGEFRHFYFNVDNEKEFSLILTVLSGKADIYLNKGLFNLPTLKNYWKKQSGSSDEELKIYPDMFEKSSDIKGVYTAGIYAKSNSKISVVYLPSFDNLINIKYQHLVNMKLSQNKPYYFELYNSIPLWNLDIYAENSDLEISIMDFNIQKEDNRDVVEILEDDTLYMEHLSFIKGSLPLKHQESNTKINMHYVIRIKATDPSAILNLIVYEPNSPVEIPVHKNMKYVGNKDEETTFFVNLNSSFEEANIDLQLFFGNVSVRYASSVEDLQKAEYSTLSIPSVRSVTFKEKSKVNDIDLFSKIYVQVKFKEFSKISLSVSGDDSFQEIKAFETKIVHLKPEEEQSIYFFLTKEMKKHSSTINIDIFTMNFFDGKPKLFFNPNDIDMEIGNETKLLPMPIDDMLDKVSGEFRHIEIKPRMQNGYYIIQLPKHQNAIPFKISIGIDDTRNLQLNGAYRFQVPNVLHKNHKFSMYLPEIGEFRFLVETCQDVSVQNAALHEFGKKKPQIFNGNLAEAKHYFYLDETSSETKPTFMNYQMKVFRGLNKTPGVLEFSLNSSDSSKNSNNDYLLLTEFKSQKRSLFFKDYIDLWSDKKNTKKFSYEWTPGKDMLRVNLFNPKFREQLLADYPQLTKIVVKFFVHIFDDKNFNERINKCGIGAIEEVAHVRQYHADIIKVPDEFNKEKALIFNFDKQSLEKFSKSEAINVFSYMSVVFLEGDMEEYEIGLDQKYATVPYFLYRIENKFGKSGISAKTLLIVALLLFLVLFLYFIKNSNNVDLNDVRNIINNQNTAEQDKSEYQNPNQEAGFSQGFSGNKIEMNEMN